MTEDNKILNLNHYDEIRIEPIGDTYVLQADYHKTEMEGKTLTDIRRSEIIGVFGTREKAESALEALFQSMKEKSPWDVRDFTD